MTGRTLYVGTRFDMSSDNPDGRCAVFDFNGDEIIPERGKYWDNSFDWGVSLPKNIHFRNVLLGDKKARANHLAYEILKRELPDFEPEPIDFTAFRRMLVDGLPYEHWEITEEDIEKVFSEILES